MIEVTEVKERQCPMCSGTIVEICGQPICVDCGYIEVTIEVVK